MSSTGSTAAAPSLSIDVLQDLDNLSDLKKTLSAESKPLLQIGSALAKYDGQAISEAAGSVTATLDLTASPSWTAGVVTFSLETEAKCTVAVAATGEDLEVAMKVDSTDTNNVQLATPADTTYINIDLDFNISASASGEGTAYGVTISGSGSTSAAATLSFCQPVPSDMLTLDALKLAFSSIVFPTSPDCMSRMVVGSSCKMNFDGSLNWELDANYGLGDYQLSAPNAAQVQQSIDNVWAQNLTPPSAEAEVGLSASVQYTHTDHLGIVITKADANNANLYLVRSSSDESDETLGASVEVTVTAPSVALDTTKLSTMIQGVTGNAKLADAIANQASKGENNLETAATAKLNKWIADVNGNVGLSLALSQQKSRTALFNFTVSFDPRNPADPAIGSWGQLLTSSLANARNIPGFTPMPGSGVAEQLSRSTTIQFNFFNFYKYSDKTQYFNNCTSELAADGTIRLFDTGVDNTITANTKVGTIRIHFTGSATEDTKGNVTNAEIDLNIELSETGDSKGAVAMAKVLERMNLPSLQTTISAMNMYAQTNPGTLSLNVILQPSAYGKLAFSAYAGSNPPQDQSADASNWMAIRDATVSLMDDLSFLPEWTYTDWGNYSSLTKTGSLGATPDRHMLVNIPVPGSFWDKDPARALQTANFFVASAAGMNLFEDLVTLAAAQTPAMSAAQWNDIQSHVAAIVKGDASTDYSKPITAAILAQVAQTGAQTTANVTQASDKSTCTATLTIAWPAVQKAG